MNDATHILVIDDEQSLRDAIVGALKDAGYNVAEAADGKQGLDQALSLRPKLIFLDYNMPVMDGQEFLKQLRTTDDWGKTVEVVYSTNSYETAIINEALAFGVHDYILKSDVSLDQIVQLAQKYIPSS